MRMREGSAVVGWRSASRGPHWISLERKINSVSTDDQREDAPRGKGDVAIGISRVPDERLDRLTAMYNPRKRVPATVEFTDIIAGTRGGAQALVDVAGYKNADALVHVVRAFRDPAVAHPA